jgi:Multicopper oxidase
MRLFECLGTILSYLLNIAQFSPFQDRAITQAPILGPQRLLIASTRKGPVFRPPGRKRHGKDSTFECDYSAMTGWDKCSTELDRGCWLVSDKGEKFDITTDYEHFTPKGILRTYTLNIYDNDTLNVDGMVFPEGKLFDNIYPGPWLQACWGDTVQVTVNNHMKHNGTSIHWHGIRQLKTMHMDGVNGITQCPIAPGKSFTYRWKALQYGSAWYHSHYSMQYADGLVGPLVCDIFSYNLSKLANWFFQCRRSMGLLHIHMMKLPKHHY